MVIVYEQEDLRVDITIFAVADYLVLVCIAVEGRFAVWGEDFGVDLLVEFLGEID